MRKNFKLLVCLMLAVMASITSVKADTYYRIKMIPVLENGASGYVFAYTQDQYSTYQYASNITKDNKWTATLDTVLHSLDDNDVHFHLCAKIGNIQSILEGWYWDADCEQPITYMQAFSDNDIYDGIYSSLGRNIEYSDNEATAPITTVYVKFTKLSPPEFDWTSYGTTTLKTGGKYYIYSPAMYRFLKATSTSTTSAVDATVFTYTYVSSSSENVTIDGVLQNLPYNNVKFTYSEGNLTKYVSARNSSSWSTSSYTMKHWPQTDGTYRMTETYSYGSANNIQVNMDGTISYPMMGSYSRGLGVYWVYIPEDTVIAKAHVNSLNENGAVTITSSPTGKGTAFVKFNVSASSVPAGFICEKSGADASDWELGSPTCSDGILSVPMTYTAKNRHYTNSPASTVTVTVTANSDPTNTASGTATAYVDFEPRFALAVDELDWSRVGENVVETFYSGQEIAASERDRLANKLVKNDAQTTGVAANNATWTATIIGTNADQFKFANGTQTVSGLYTADLLDVHYAPTTTGNHEATLHIVTSYTDANSHTESVEHDITLKGIGSAASRITFAKAGNQLPTNAEEHNFGEIIGTNQQEITADLFISQITNPKMEWTGDSAGVFEFVNQNDVVLSQLNQTLTFRAHRQSPVTENTVHTATLTVSGKGTANEDVSATITLTYTALPLIQTTVTWNWATIKENATVTNPITTNSDGVWTLEKSVGDKITYNDEGKTATAAYLHHEPGVTAQFVFHQDQTDTYSAFDEEYEMTIMPKPAPMLINSSKYNEYKNYVSNASYAYMTDDVTLYVWLETVGFAFVGNSTFSFDFKNKATANFQLTEYYENGTNKKVFNQYIADGFHEFELSPNVTEIRIYCNGWLSNMHYDGYDISLEYDTIAANKEQIAMIYDNGNISTFDVSATFANKQQVTASLNAAAAQYFEIRSEGKSTGSSMVFDSNDGLGLGLAQDKVFTIALKSGANADEARTATAGNACQLIYADDYTYNHEVLSLPILVIEPCEITYKHSANGSYTVTYQNDEIAHLVDDADYPKSINTQDPADYVLTLSAPTPASGYQFQGWKINNVLVSCLETFTTSVGITGSVVEAIFVPVEAQNFKVGDVYFANFDAALNAANSSSDCKVVTLMQDVTLGDGTTPINYTIPAGVTLLIPHKADFFELQETPDLVNVNSDALELAQKLSAYRTLTLKEGVTITCNGNICVAGNMVTANGGRKSAYPTGEVGLINMVHGGHIELNNGAQLYCWGYIKGQDMDQGNNTVGTGTVTANSGSIVWENFELGDWRGGSASLDIYNNTENRKLFPFQSYAIQNIEIPTTFKFGSYLKNYTSITTGYGNHGAVFSMIGPAETMFLLTDEDSKVRTWYDATTDLTCYELSGTAQLDALHITVYVSMSSENYNLPISNSMHIILDSCDMTLAKPMMVQAGAVVEIKKDAIVNLTDNLFLYDVDQWGKYAHNYYFRSFNNITSHKDRGAENSKAGLDDAKLIVDGILNVNKDDEHNTVGKIYATKGGANVKGNNGGVINFNTTLPDSAWLWAVEVKSGIPYIEWVRNRVYAANLCNEDGSYTRSMGNHNSFYNVNGRWFHSEDKNPDPDNHTYWFTYIANVNDNPENDPAVNAVYSHDKTGLEARMKWFNVEPDENCPTSEPEEDFTSDWWKDAAGRFYNYTMLGDWHQFIATEQANVYSGSDNKLYQKDDCDWTEEGAVDENCLYTIGGEKKALVNGSFIALESNGYDPAYHNGDQYYICFSGCNWHPATPYSGESKAYTIHPETEDLHYIWFENDWLNVERDGAFFFTADEQTNVRTYYEYVNGDWVVATPYVSVTDDAETRNFYMIKEAFNVAQIKKNATIKLLRDLTNVSEVLSFSTQNTTCTLDLNGHVLSGTVANLVTVNAPGCTFTITDNAALKIGKITTTQSKAVYAQKGTVVLSNGTLEATGAYAIECASNGGAITINGGYLAAATQCVHVLGSCTINGGHFTMNTGLVTYCAANKYPFETEDEKYRYEVSTGYTITFKDGATTLQTLHVKPGETPQYTANQPTKDDYKFTGWSPAIVAATTAATYTAQFTTKAAEERCVTLNSNGGNEGLQYVYVTTDAAIGTLPTGTTKDGHTFAGWFTENNGGTQITTATTVSADVTWYAHYNKNTYTLTWDANGGNLAGGTPSGSVQFGTSITAPTATKEGHTFLGWNATPAATMSAHDVTYTAQWSVLAKHYLQNLDGTYPETPAATDDVTGAAGEYVTPATKTYDGFITPATQTVQIGDTDVVTYNYVRRTYTITWDANGGYCAKTSSPVKHGATLSLPNATRTGLELIGWFTKPVGGDEITESTEILRNIGTLYAHWTEEGNSVVAKNGDEITIDDAYVAANGNGITYLVVENGGTVTVAANIAVDNLVLESSADNSGQLKVTNSAQITTTNAYYDLKLNTEARHWHAFGVPWNVDVNVNPIIEVETGRTLVVGRDCEIVWYNGATRAAQGAGAQCWEYLKHYNEAGQPMDVMTPGKGYMIAFTIPVQTVRLTKASGADIFFGGSNSVTGGSGEDGGWNAIANPMPYHATLNAGPTVGYVHDGGEIGSDGYTPYDINGTKYIVGKTVYVQAGSDQSIVVNPAGAAGDMTTISSAPRRRTASIANKQYLSLSDYYAVSLSNGDQTSKVYVVPEDDKADNYVIGHDLSQFSMSTKKPQIWVNRYDTKLALNTTAPINGTADFSVSLYAPAAGEYTINNNQSPITNEDYTVYLTLNGQAIWNLTDGAYTLSLDKGTVSNYGIRVSAKAPMTPTGIDEAVVDAQGETRKVLINNQVFIIRGNQVYTIDGQLVK